MKTVEEKHMSELKENTLEVSETCYYFRLFQKYMLSTFKIKIH